LLTVHVPSEGSLTRGRTVTGMGLLEADV